MGDRIIEKIIEKTGVSDLLNILGEKLTIQDWQSLLLTISAKRTDQIKPAQLLKAYENNRFVQPLKGISPTQLQRFLIECDQLLPASFESIILSPVAPLGSCSSLATVHQNKVLSASRNVEVVADATNVLALEASLRRKKHLKENPKSTARVQLATTHRHIRGQSFENPAFTAHFQVQCLVSAGRDQGNFLFEQESLNAHIDYYINLLSQSTFGIPLDRLTVSLSIFNPRFSVLHEAIASPLLEKYPDLTIDLDPERETGRGYYDHLCFHIIARFPSGQSIPICDGGFTNWTQQLLASQKERVLISGFGSELWLRLLS